MILTFKDCQGRDWNLKINLGTVNRLRDANVIDLMRLTENNMERYRKLMTDPCDLVGVVWEILKPAAGDVTLQEFMESLDGDAIDDMMACFSRALADFFPALRSLILKGMEKGTQLRKVASDNATAMIDRIDPTTALNAEIEKTEKEIAKMIGSAGTSSPGNAAQA